LTTRFVVDASVVLAAVLGDDELGSRAAAVMGAMKDATALVPAIWQAEVANVLVVKFRQKRIDESLLNKLVKLVGELPVEVDLAAARETFDRALPVAKRHQLSVYDACYLELAVREAVPVASFDKALREAAKREGIGHFEGV
jgi:predicted nucleic acid-binding protein